MDRKGIIAVSISLVVLVVWMFYSNKEYQKAAAAHAIAVAQEEAAKAEAAPEGAQPSTTATPATPGAATATTAANPEAASSQPAVAEKLEELSTESTAYEFTNLGGGISRVILKKHEAEKGKPMVLNDFGAVPIGSITEAAGEGTNIPFTTKVDATTGEVTFDRTDARQVQLTKRFVVNQETGLDKDYIIQLEATFTNKGAQPVTLPGYFIHTGGSTPVHEKDLATYTGFKWSGGKLIEAHAFDGGMFKTARPIISEVHPEISWAGVVNQYFTTIVAPRVEGPNVAQLDGKNGVSIWAKRFDVTADMWKEAGRTSTNPELKHYGVNGALGMPGFTLEPGKSLTQKFQIYTGPREYGRLRLLPNDQADIMDFGMFGFVSKTLLNTMNWIHGKVGTYAAAIILLTLLIKTLLWPLQNKATQSMKRMQLLAPLQTDLREKYKDDPTRMNAEVMKLYKDYGVNPLSGCLPMLIQIPIFFGFYNMLGKAVELRNSKFLWVHDLSQPDTIWHFPVVGYPLNVLPLLMAGTMLWQMSLSPKSGDPMQQRIFMFMPLIFIAFCYNFASALALYWTVQNLFSVVQLYATRNQAPPTLAKVTAPSKRK